MGIGESFAGVIVSEKMNQAVAARSDELRTRVQQMARRFRMSESEAMEIVVRAVKSMAGDAVDFAVDADDTENLVIQIHMTIRLGAIFDAAEALFLGEEAGE